jgi:nucleotide-binding universal stress UspA family protein
MKSERDKDMNVTATTSRSSELKKQRRVNARSPLVLLATDGSESSAVAYAAAELIAANCGARVHVLSVVEPLPMIVPPPGTPILSTGLIREREDALRADMVEQLLKLGRLAKWTSEMRVGTPASVIAKVANERKADLIIVGSNRHGMADRLLGEETATELAKLIERPLLIASPFMTRLPKRVVVALDLSSADRSALVNVLDIIGSPQSVSLLHVQPRSQLLGVDWAEYDDEYRARVEGAFRELNDSLATLPKAQTELVVMHGDVACEINEFAASVKAELIVLGVKRRRDFSVAPGGGIAMKVVRKAECSVLLVPSCV